MACAECCGSNSGIINPLGSQTVLDGKPLITKQIVQHVRIPFPPTYPVKMIFLPHQQPVQLFLNRFNTQR